MTDAVQIALIAGCVSAIGSIPATIAALAAWRQGKVNGIKTDVVIEKADVITGHVNGAAEAAIAKIEQLQREIAHLKERP